MSDTCSVCAGAPLPSGRPCICAGTGTLEGELVGLRLECLALREQVDALVKVLEMEVDESGDADNVATQNTVIH